MGSDSLSPGDPQEGVGKCSEERAEPSIEQRQVDACVGEVAKHHLHMAPRECNVALRH